ncbi:MAG: ABC transporter permease [Christensenellales bacterium]
MSALLQRNLKIFFRDRASVFFSLLSVFIIIALYALFLGDLMLGSSVFQGRPGVRGLMDSWLMSGVLAAVSVTSALGALGTMVDDKSARIDMDFISSPIRRSAITGGYVASAFLVSIAMSLTTCAIAILYITLRGGLMPGAGTLLEVGGCLLLSSFSSTALMFLLTSFLPSSSAFGLASTLIGSLIGFLAGVYVPVGQLPEGIRAVVNFIPASHSAALLRQSLTSEPLRQVFSGAPASLVTEFRQAMGIDLYWGGQAIQPLVHLLVLLGTGLLFFALSTLRMTTKRK